MAMGGYIGVLWQPWEFVIILGTALGTFIVANPMKVIKDSLKGLGEAFGNAAPTSRNYLDVMGLLETMADFCENFRATYKGVDVSLKIDITEPEVPDALKVPIFRILQEAMNNAAKHSHADRIAVGIGKGERIELRISDNGAGCDPGETSSAGGQGRNLGLFSMRERAELSGGSLQFRSAPGEGTEVRASWPVPDV